MNGPTENNYSKFLSFHSVLGGKRLSKGYGLDKMKSVKLRIGTFGHSNRTIEDFIELLHGHKIELVTDVRRFPSSRRYPHFNQPELERSLAEHGIGCRHFPDLGGRRVPRRDSQNSLWRHEGFRGYADYLKASGAEVLHSLSSAKAEEHTYTQPARIVEGKLTYSVPQSELQLNLKNRGVNHSSKQADQKPLGLSPYWMKFNSKESFRPKSVSEK